MRSVEALHAESGSPYEPVGLSAFEKNGLRLESDRIENIRFYKNFVAGRGNTRLCLSVRGPLSATHR